ncbi:hypothetical protein ABVT39_025857 [Epinephelus coioides]
MTPPPSPDIRSEAENAPVPGPSRQYIVGRKNVRRGRRRLQNESEQLQALLERERKKKEKYKKRYQRLAGVKKSPHSVGDALLYNQTVNNTIRRRVLLQESIIEDIRNKYKNTKKEREKQIIAKTTIGKIIRKYSLQRAAQVTPGFSKKRCQRPDGGLITFERKLSNRLPAECKEKVKTFFLRDDVSRMITGKKQTVTQKKNKKQKRLLTDTMKNLHQKVLSENEHQVSYSCFCTLRPFWVVVPTEADRKTCQCSTHENLEFMANTLYSQGLTASKNLEEMSDATMCDPKSKLCAYGECKDCILSTHAMLRAPTNTEVAITQWSLEDNNKLNDGEESGRRSTITAACRWRRHRCGESAIRLPHTGGSAPINSLCCSVYEETEAHYSSPVRKPTNVSALAQQCAGGGGTGVGNLQSGCRTPAAALQSIHSAAAFIRRQKPTTRRQSVNRQTSVLWLKPSRPEVITKENIGLWCIVTYDGEPYPGIILEVEDVLRVKCMHKNGTNKFYWSSPRDDIHWYPDDQIVCLMREPQPLNKRSVQLERQCGLS